MQHLLPYAVSIGLALASPAFAEGHGQSLDYSVEGKSFQAYVVSPSTPSKGKVFIVHDWDGLNDYEKGRANQLAALGYEAVALDLFGIDAILEGPEDYRRETGALYADRSAFRARLKTAVTAASGTFGADTKAFMIGFCFGGAATLEAARAGLDLDGFVSFHGGLSTPEGQDYAATKGPVLVLHGSADPASGMAALANLLDQLQAANIPHGAEVFGGARHSFTVMGSRDYDAAAEQGAWQAFMRFLEKNS